MFLLPVRGFLYLITEKQRRKAIQKSCVSIKATDMLASLKLLYAIFMFPITLLGFCLVLLSTAILIFHFSFVSALKFTLAFGIILPLYFYLAVGWYDNLVYNGRIFIVRMKYFKIQRQKGLNKLRSLEKLRYEIKVDIDNIISKYEDSLLSEDLQSRIIERRKSEFGIEAKLDQLSNIIEHLS